MLLKIGKHMLLKSCKLLHLFLIWAWSRTSIYICMNVNICIQSHLHRPQYVGNTLIKVQIGSLYTDINLFYFQADREQEERVSSLHSPPRLVQASALVGYLNFIA
jgi:hypothetical protein